MEREWVYIIHHQNYIVQQGLAQRGQMSGFEKV